MYNVSDEFINAVKGSNILTKCSVGIGNKSITNMILNGNFINGQANWGLSNSTGSVSNNEFTFLANKQWGQIYQSRTSVVNNKYYIRAIVKSNSNLITLNTQSANIKSHTGSGNWEILSAIKVSTTSAMTIIILDNRASGWDNVVVKEVLCIDLTSMFGVGKEPTVEYMDELIAKTGWFDGDKNIGLYWLDNNSVKDIKIESLFGNGDLPTIGSTMSARLSMTLINGESIPQVLIGTPIRPYVGVDVGGKFEWVALGEFYSDYDDINISVLETKLNGFDTMIKFDSTEYTTTKTLPLTVNDIILELSTKYGIKFSKQTLPNVSLSEVPSGTLRQVISHLAGLMTTNAVIDYDGKVKFVFLNQTTFTLNKHNYVDFKLKPDSIVKISQLKVDNGKEVNIVGDSSGYSLEFKNPQIATSAILNDVYNRSFPLNYYGYNMKCQGMPHLQVGDIITFTYLTLDGTEKTINIPIIKHSFTYNGGMMSDFTSNSPKDKVTKTTVTSGSGVGDAIGQSYDELLEAMRESLRIVTGNEGGNVITILDENGKPIELVIADTDNINTAKNVWRWNNGGLYFSDQGYSPTDPNALRVAITADGKINADFITTGQLNGDLIKANSIKAGSLELSLREQIQNSATKEYVDTSLNVLSGEINANITSSINKIEIGSNNYIRNSAFKKDLLHWTTSGGVIDVIGVNDTKSLKITGEFGKAKYVKQDIRGDSILSKITNVMVSCIIKGDSIVKGSINPFICLYVEVHYTDGTINYLGKDSVPLGNTDWIRYVVNVPIITNKVINEIRVFGYGRDFTGSVWFDNFQLEIGNKVTDFKESQFDMQESIDSSDIAISGLVDVTKTQSTTLKALSDSYNVTVSELNTTKNDLETLNKSVTTQFTQTNESFTYNFEAMTSRIDNLDEYSTTEIENIKNYIKFVGGNIILGQSGNDFTLMITNEKISFLQGGKEVAYLSNSKLYITQGEILNSLKLGRYSFKPRDNGNLSFRWE